MQTRRQFARTAAAGAVATLCAPAIVRAAPAKMRVGLASGVTDAQVAFQSIGMHPKLHWYQDGGVELEILNSTNTSQPLQLLATGQIEFATIAPGTLIPTYAKNPKLGIVCPYMWMPRIHNRVAVKPDSPLKSIAELKGKTVGVRHMGDSGYPFLQAVLKEMAMDPQKDVKWLAVGAGATAGQALYNGTVDALAIWDVEFVRIGIAGFQTRYLPNPPSASKLFGNAYAVNRDAFMKNKERFAKTFQAIAKGQIFNALNPQAAIKLHWDLYPETKPKGKTTEEAMADMVKILNERHDKWFPDPASPDQRMGASTKDMWEAAVRFIGQLNPAISAAIKDVSVLYDTSIIAEANAFDRKAFEDFAKAFKA
jgi:NitT/TauT family transport system substrate-binding protein